MAVLVVLLGTGAATGAAPPPGAWQGGPERTEASSPAKSKTTSPPAEYRLSPERRAEAIAYSRACYSYYFLGVALSILIYLLFWFGRVGVSLRNLARRISCHHIVQCLVFVPLFLGAASLIELPLDYASDFVLERRFDLSTQTFGSWLANWGKVLALSIVAGIFLVWIFYVIVRRSPRRWWFYFWLVTIPVMLFVMFVEPYVVEPLFFKFTPLDRSHPALVEQIERMLHRANLEIPPARIFEMNASSKTRTINAYVSGLGPSKRVVVWDTALERMSSDEILVVLGHETGHYVLHHIPKEFAWDELVTLGFFWLGFVSVTGLVKRFASRTGLEGEGDLASLPLLLLALTVVVFLSSPVVNGISRHYEHQADQFGLEVTYGVVPDPNAAEVRAFEILGERDLSDPDPNPFIRFWLYSHPPLGARIRFAASYHPWAEGKPLEFVHGAGNQ